MKVHEHCYSTIPSFWFSSPPRGFCSFNSRWCISSIPGTFACLLQLLFWVFGHMSRGAFGLSLTHTDPALVRASRLRLFPLTVARALGARLLTSNCFPELLELNSCNDTDPKCMQQSSSHCECTGS